MSLALLVRWVSSGLISSGASHLIVPPAFAVELRDTKLFESFTVARPKSAIHARLDRVMSTLT